MNTVDGGSGRRRVGRSRPLKWRVEDSLWERLEPLLADPPRRFRYPGRCRYPARACLEGFLYVLFTDTPWLEVPYRELGLPSGETCRRRLEEWSRRGLLEAALRVLQRHLAAADRLDWSRLIVDASLVDAKKGARRSRARSWAGREARHRFPIERTNAWLKAKRRIATRRDRKADNYLAFLHLGMIIILARSF